MTAPMEVGGAERLAKLRIAMANEARDKGDEKNARAYTRAAADSLEGSQLAVARCHFCGHEDIVASPRPKPYYCDAHCQRIEELVRPAKIMTGRSVQRKPGWRAGLRSGNPLGFYDGPDVGDLL